MLNYLIILSYFFIITVILYTSVTSCRKTTGKMKVIKDCTGHYLRFDSQDFPICNIEIVSNVSSGTDVDATFRKIGNANCASKGQTYCMMVHPYPIGEWIEVKRIK